MWTPNSGTAGRGGNPGTAAQTGNNRGLGKTGQPQGLPLHFGLREWSGCTESRVGTAHDYSGEKVQACLDIMGDFIEDAIGLYQTMTGESWD